MREITKNILLERSKLLQIVTEVNLKKEKKKY